MEILYKAVFTHSAVSLPKVNRFGFFATNDRFRLNLLLCRKVGHNSISHY